MLEGPSFGRVLADSSMLFWIQAGSSCCYLGRVSAIHSVEHAFQDCVSLVRVAGTSETLWHYTTAEVLLRILDSGSLHLTCYRFMNDPGEGQVASSLVDVCWQIALNRATHHPRLDLNWLRRNVTSVPKLEYPGASDQSTFVFSASSKGDLLSQWARYADDGRGVALGLTVNTALLTSGAPTSAWSYGPHLSRVMFWSTTEREATPESAFDSSNLLVGQLSSRLYEFLMEAQDVTELQNGLLMVTEGLAPSIKSEGYAEEHELRLSAHTDLRAKELYHLKANRHGIAPVMTIAIDGAAIKVTSIVIGPRLGPETLWSLRWLREKYGLEHVTIQRSNLAYR
jgi:hypothetical protein